MRDSREQFLGAIRRRMRWAWLIATLQYLAPYLAAVAGIAALADWLTPTDSLLIVSLAAIAVLVVGVLVWSLFKPITTWQAARSAERGLDARDSLTTALEFDDVTQPFHPAIQDQADKAVAGRKPREAIRFLTDRRRLRNAALLATLALVIGFLPPLGSEPALSSSVQEALDDEAEELERIADALEDADVEKGADETRGDGAP